jgi:hypothetical protein
LRRLVWVGAIAVGLAGVVAALGAFARTGWFAGRPPVSPLQEEDLADVFRIKWVGKGELAFLADQERATREGIPVVFRCDMPDGTVYERRGYPFATILAPETNDICALGTSACAFEFELQARPGKPWVRIDGIDVIVQDYSPLPKYKTTGSLGGGGVVMHVYYAEIDNPSLAKTSQFSARYLFEPVLLPGAMKLEQKRHELAFVRLTEGEPQAFLVRVNAKTPGVYTLSAVVRLSYRDTEREQTIVNTATYLFDIAN